MKFSMENPKPETHKKNQKWSRKRNFTINSPSLSISVSFSSCLLVLPVLLLISACLITLSKILSPYITPEFYRNLHHSRSSYPILGLSSLSSILLIPFNEPSHTTICLASGWAAPYGTFCDTGIMHLSSLLVFGINVIQCAESRSDLSPYIAFPDSCQHAAIIESQLNWYKQLKSLLRNQCK